MGLGGREMLMEKPGRKGETPKKGYEGESSLQGKKRDK